MTKTAELKAVLGSQTADKSVHAEALLKVIHSADSSDERADLLAIAFIERDSVTKTPKILPNKGIPDDRWDMLVKTHADLVNGHLKMAFFKSRTARDFASEVLRLVDFLPESDEKTFVVAEALFSPYVPYRELPGTPVHMSNAEYQHKLESDKDRVSLIDYIMGLPFDERTERASMLIQVIDDTNDRDLRVALLAHADFVREKKIIEAVLAKK